jgi:hydroxymethylbilane synthase
VSVVIGTRGSALALAQARLVASRIGDDAEIRVLRTAGDASLLPIRELGDGAFVGGLEEALLRREVDLAVHSLKDLPTAEREGLVVAAIPRREDPRDVLVTASRAGLPSLPDRAIVGTSSPRRAAFLRALRRDVRIREIRGNVDTRLRKVREGEYDAAVLALAGLRRLGIAVADGEILDERVMPPAPGQGALAVQCRADDGALRARLRPLEDRDTRVAVDTERVLLAALGASCALRLGALGRVDGALVRLAAALPVGDEIARFEGAGPDPARLAAAAAGALGAAFLDGVTVVLTRDDEDDRGLADELRALHARVVVAPCVRVEPLADHGPLSRELAALGPDDLLVVTSRAGAAAVAACDVAPRAPVATIGEATAQRLRELGIAPAFVAGSPSGTALGSELPLPSGTVVLARSDRATTALPGILRDRGARVREVVAYRTVVEAAGAIASAREALAGGPRPTIVVFASPSAVLGFVREVGGRALARATCVAIGPTTAASIADLAGAAAITARMPDAVGLLSAVVAAARRHEEVTRVAAR